MGSKYSLTLLSLHIRVIIISSFTRVSVFRFSFPICLTHYCQINISIQLLAFYSSIQKTRVKLLLLSGMLSLSVPFHTVYLSHDVPVFTQAVIPIAVTPPRFCGLSLFLQEMSSTLDIFSHTFFIHICFIFLTLSELMMKATFVIISSLCSKNLVWYFSQIMYS